MPFQQARPEDNGISPRSILRFLDACEREIKYLHSFSIIRGMACVASGSYKPVERERPHLMFSLSKSLTSLAVGIALGEGKFNLDDCLVRFFQDDLPEKHDPRVERITIRNVLMMASSSAYFGSHISDGPNWRANYLGLIPEREPGTYFSYDTGGTYMLSCLVGKTMGMSVRELLNKRVFVPMGMEPIEWQEDPQGNSVGGWGAYVKPKDLPKIGRLLLNYGKWEGKQLVPELYLRQALSKHIDTYQNPCVGYPYGYGYQFWMFQEKSFVANGAFGQLLICSPEKDICVATTAGCKGRHDLRLSALIAETILAEALDYSIPRDDDAYGQMMDKISRLSLPTSSGGPVGVLEASVFGKTYACEENSEKIDAIRFDRAGERLLCITFGAGGKRIKVTAGNGAWVTGIAAGLDNAFNTVHSFCYGWKDDGNLEVRQIFGNTPKCKIYTFHFDGDTLEFKIRINVSLFAERPERVVGRAAPY